VKIRASYAVGWDRTQHGRAAKNKPVAAERWSASGVNA
jgi:hypothetical protein